MKIMVHQTQEVVDEAARIQIEVDKIFETARSNNWTLETFAVKVLAGAMANNLGYFSIAAQLVQNVTRLDGFTSIEILRYMLFKVEQQDSVKIQQAQVMFFRGLIINKEKAELAKQKQQKELSKQTSKKRRN
ncbi:MULTISPECIES: hypothetical protein [unclassified Microcoleus]|uniref:hypothetical protein n=1 Tax=unclassified Microcoleus TaxID=2642155 RepID=UPI002FCF3BB9